MFELFVILLLVGGAYISLKILGALFHVGAFLILLPFKILFAILGIVIAILTIPFAIIPIFIGLLLPLALVGLVVWALVALVR